MGGCLFFFFAGIGRKKTQLYQKFLRNDLCTNCDVYHVAPRFYARLAAPEVLENMDDDGDGYVDFEEMKRAIMEDGYSIWLFSSVGLRVCFKALFFGAFFVQVVLCFLNIGFGVAFCVICISLDPHSLL